MIAYVAHVGSTKQRVADGMDKHIGVTMPQQSETVGYLYSANPKLAAFNQAVDIISEPYSYLHIRWYINV